MNDLAAAIGLVQLEKLPEFNEKRSNIIKEYLCGLIDIEGIMPLLPFEPDKYTYQMFGIRAEFRNDLIIYLKSKGISTGCHYTPLSTQPLFKEWGENCPFIEKEADKFITLPLHSDLKNEDYVIQSVSSFYK
jgi:perosamine synthetase